MTRTPLYITLTGIVTALFLCAPIHALAFRGAGPGYGPGCREPGVFWCISGLDLTEKQRADIEALQKETRDKIIPLREELQRLEIPEALFAQTIDAAALEALLARKKNINAEILEIRHESMISAVQLLTPEQRAIMLERKNSPPFFKGRSGRGQGWNADASRAECPWW